MQSALIPKPSLATQAQGLKQPQGELSLPQAQADTSTNMHSSVPALSYNSLNAAMETSNQLFLQKLNIQCSH